MEHVVLVDEQDREIGTMEKLEAHQKGLLHRAFSVLLFNSRGEMLLQKRASCKYHSAGLWSNACCSHPRPGEKMEEAARRRMKEELGIDVQPEFVYKFKYKVALENDLEEHEFDHVFVCQFDGTPSINTEEVENWKFVDFDQLRSEINQSPEKFTYWLALIAERYPEYKLS